MSRPVNPCVQELLSLQQINQKSILKESVKFCNRKTTICAGQEHFHQSVKGMFNVIFIFNQINHKLHLEDNPDNSDSKMVLTNSRFSLYGCENEKINDCYPGIRS